MSTFSACFSLEQNGKVTAHSQLEEDGKATTYFDDILGLALLISQAPVVVLALGQAEMLLRTQAGVELSFSHLYSFCQQAGSGHNSGLTEVANLTHDPHLAQHPAVADKPYLRFYASTRLPSLTAEQPVTLYVLDTKSRQLSAAQRDGLLMLARYAAAQRGSGGEQTSVEQASGLVPGIQGLPATTRSEVFVKHEHRFVRLLNTDIYYVEALGDYVNFYTNSLGRLTQYTTMKEMERKLPWADFARVHRKYIVRLDCIVAIVGDVLHLDTGHSGHPSEIAIGNSYKSSLLNRLTLV